MSVMWPLSVRWYGDRLDRGYQPKSPQALQEILTAAGLVDDFWRLAPTGP